MIDSVSPMTTLPAGAPISRPTRSPTSRGIAIQPQVFQPRISSAPHSPVSIFCMRAGAPTGSGPSELPSR
ncbi:hypothetical protein RISW2_02230 [Roseivivax isoporae LMG 25204]|uniref:Uncharacterized protein n=1 Tax=Roseivivax isoporae LMG 25204 TaxID=1449351 RepID=X7F900_9RHOB|nr:hypothetical protein RISW2_02230 [Roseivivax isoporae LMG 25204]